MIIRHSPEEWKQMGLNDDLARELFFLALPDRLIDKGDLHIRFEHRLSKEKDGILIAHGEFGGAIYMGGDGAIWFKADGGLRFLQSSLSQLLRCVSAFHDFLEQPPITPEWSEERDLQEGQILRKLIGDIDPRAAEESVLWSIRIEEFTEGVLTRD